jgi:EmrB/QacA subfamily drug resistance transporter
MSNALHTSCDRALADTSVPAVHVPEATNHPNLVLATCILASTLAFIDGSIVNVGLPAIGRGLSAGGGSLAWVVNGYLLPLSALLLIGGAAGDLYGRRRLLIVGVALFAVASILCAVAPSLPLLIGGRVLQGVGAALLLPNSLAILAANFDGEKRGRAIGIWAAAGAVGGAVGPLAGGWLIDAVGWRAMFLVSVPIAAGAIFLAARYLHDDACAEQRPPIDGLGATLASASLVALTWGLTVASERSGITGAAVAALLLGAVLGVFFILTERRRSDRAMLPLTLFSSRSFDGLSVLTFLLYGAMSEILVLVPYVLIEVKKYSAMEAGAALLPLPLILALTSPLMGRIAGKIGSRRPLTIGPMIVCVGLWLSTRVVSDGSYWTTTLPAMVVISLGMAGAVAPLTTAVFASVKKQHAGVASGFNSALARTGGLVATALLGGIFAAHGADLVSAYRVAVLVGAVAALAAGLVAFASIDRIKPQIAQTADTAGG